MITLGIDSAAEVTIVPSAFMGIGGLSLLAYLLMIGGVSFCIAIRKHLNILYLLLGFATLHLSNGCGMLVSLFTAKSYVRRINAQRQ